MRWDEYWKAHLCERARTALRCQISVATAVPVPDGARRDTHPRPNAPIPAVVVHSIRPLLLLLLPPPAIALVPLAVGTLPIALCRLSFELAIPLAFAGVVAGGLEEGGVMRWTVDERRGWLLLLLLWLLLLLRGRERLLVV